MISVNVKSNIFEAIHKMQVGANASITKATVSAINKTAALVKTQSAREIRDVGYGLKVSAIKSQIKITKASGNNLTATVRATGKPIALINYSARQTSSGVTVAVKNGRKLIKGAFIAVMPSGHKGVYVRVGNTHKKVMRNGRVQTSGLPIKELFGPSIPDAFGNELVQAALQRLVEDRFPDLLAHEINFRIIKR